MPDHTTEFAHGNYTCQLKNVRMVCFINLEAILVELRFMPLQLSFHNPGAMPWRYAAMRSCMRYVLIFILKLCFTINKIVSKSSISAVLERHSEHPVDHVNLSLKRTKHKNGCGHQTMQR